MSKKTIYFHIGTHKTGTTALQKFFVQNKETLKRKGIIYDFYSEKEYNQGYLINPKKWEEIDLDPSYNYLISGEDFYSHILDISDIVKSKTTEFNIKFIIYLKRQDLMKQSVYNQIVKMHGFYHSIEEDNHYNLDYYNFLKKLKKLFKEAEIVVQVYENPQFRGGTIYSDFLQILNLNIDDGFAIEDKIVNPSLSRDKLELIRLVNMFALPTELRVNISKLLINTAITSNEVALFRKQNLISPNESKSILKRYEESNSMLAKEFLGRKDGKLFYEPVDEDKQWKSYEGLPEQIAINIFQNMLSMDRDNLLKKLYHDVMQKQNRTKEFIQAANFIMPILNNLLDDVEEFEPFVELYGIYKYTNSPADIFREIALVFEKKGDLTTAYALMKEAHKLRPNGPFIRQKIDAYQKILGKTHDKK